MQHPDFITEIEKTLDISFHRAPAQGNDPIRNVMACRRDPTGKSAWLAQYALHEDGTLAGLNLAGQGLTDQHWLYLSGFGLSRVEALNLRGNEIRQLAHLEQMPELRFLDLCNNKLENFELPAGMDALEHLWLDGNELNDAVLLARVKQGRRALLEHLRTLGMGDVEELYEARMLIIGEPSSGKTSLRKKLQNVANELPTESTMGIDVDIDFASNTFPYTTSSGQQVTFHYQVWDFGGQRQYHPTHQLFFVKSTLYLLVSNTRNDHRNEGDVEFWLETVKKLGEGSPVLRIENKHSDRVDSTDWTELEKRFPGMVKGKFEINLKQVTPKGQPFFNQADVDEFNKLKNAIEFHLKNLEHVGSKVTPAWKRIRDAIAAEAKNTPYISFDRFQQICTAHGYKDATQQLDLSKTFHTLGIFLHYQHHAVLRNTVILQNEWAIDAVFAILDSPLVRKKGGCFEHKDLPEIWKHERYDNKWDDLLQLLQEFELCYPLPKNRGYVAPQCLPKTTPEWEWNTTDNVRVDVTYDFLPRAVITRLIVKMHENIAHEKRWVWQQGAVFEGKGLHFPDTQAYVQEIYKKTESPKIAIRLRGKYSEDLFREIQSKLTDINGDFPNLKIDYLIYCNCEGCKKSGAPTLFRYFDELLYYRREKKRETIECRTTGEQVMISEVLSGIISPAQAREDQDKFSQFKQDVKNFKAIMDELEPISPEKSNNHIYGMLIAFLIIVPTIGLSTYCLPTGKAVLTIVGALFFLMLGLVYAGAQSKTFSEDTFVKISERILSKIPGLASIVTLIKGQ